MILKKYHLFLGRHFPYLLLSASMPVLSLFPFCAISPYPPKHLEGREEGLSRPEAYHPTAPTQLADCMCLGRATQPTSVTESQDVEGT